MVTDIVTTVPNFVIKLQLKTKMNDSDSKKTYLKSSLY
jgi:hypothetical protein